MKKVLLVLFAIIIGINLNTQAESFSAVNNGATIYYKITSSTYPRTVEVTFRGSSYSSYPNEYSGTVSIPDSVLFNNNYYKVTSIGNNAFRDCTGLTSITIPNSVTSIGDDAFYYCSGLTSIIIPNSVTSIGYRAFCICHSLSSITIPNSVTSIGNSAFYGCSGLTSVTIPNSVTSIGSGAFESCTRLASVEIPNSVTSIGNNAFNSCTSLTSITIPNSVTSIGDNAFDGCTGLTSITIPNSVTSIGSSAFSYCTGLTSITIPNSVTSIGDYAFSYCTGLTSITIPNSVTSIGNYAFLGCTGLTSITIPNSVTSIGNYAFYNCSGLTSVTIPNSVTSIGGAAFSYCYGLTSISIPNSVTSIGNFAFSRCTGLTSITIPNSVTSIGDNTFQNCTGLTSITIPNSVTSIGGYAFVYCTGLTSITIPNSVTSIGNGAFWGCSGLTSITIPNSVTSIGYQAFNNCTSLDTVYFNAIYCNSIGDASRSAFQGCNNFKTLIIGDSVQNISARAFINCSTLTSITTKAINPPSIEDNSFFGVSKTIPFNLPCISIQSYQSNSYWNEFTNKIGGSPRAAQFITTSICPGETYTDYGANINTAGDYTLVNGCDSVILNLSIKPTFQTDYYDTICKGQNYNNYGFSFVADTSGIYKYNLQAVNSCDSVICLNLFVNPIYNDTIIAEICNGETYSQFGFNENSSGFYTQNLQTIKGCDSIIVLNLNACPNPSELFVMPSKNYAIANWVAGSTETEWIVEYKKISDTIWNSHIISTTIDTLFNLNPSTGYKIRIKASCSVSDVSDWITFNFKTTEWDGFGDIQNPFKIKCVEDLIILSNNVMTGVNFNNIYFEMKNDINFKSSTTDSSKYFTPIGGWADSLTNNNTVFSGYFDGNGYSILNYSIYKSNNINLGLFGYTDGAGIKNIRVLNCYFNGSHNVSSLIGYCKNTLVNNCHIDSTEIITGHFANVGGLVAVNDSSIISNSVTKIKINGGIAGGIAASNNGDILNCHFSGEINSTSDGMSGGIVAVNNGRIIKSSSKGNIYFGVVNGGICGDNRGLISQSYAKVNTFANSAALRAMGGLVGENNGGVIEDCYFIGSIFPVSSFCKLGGFVGKNSGKICNSYAIPDFSSTSNYHGLFIGENNNNSIVYNNYYLPINYTTQNVVGSGLGQGITMKTQSEFLSDHFPDTLNRNHTLSIPWIIDFPLYFNNGNPIYINDRYPILKWQDTLERYYFEDFKVIYLTANTANISIKLNERNKGGENIYYCDIKKNDGIFNSLTQNLNHDSLFVQLNNLMPNNLYQVRFRVISNIGEIISNEYSFTTFCDTTITNIYDTICQEEVYNNFGFNFNADTSGLYTQELLTINGCDSIVNLLLVVNPIYNDTIFAEICNGETYTLNGFNVNTAGFYTQNLLTIKGCDSIVNLSLIINPIYNDTILAEICSNETYTLNGFNVNTAGFYTQNLQTTKGCDSVVNLNLIVNPIYLTNHFDTICKGKLYNNYGFNFTSDTSGFYTQNLQTIKGCDSIINLNLIVNPIYNDTIIAEICNGETYSQFGFNENTAGFYTQSLQTIKGCDSIVNLNLIINPIYNDTILAEICSNETYTLNGFNVNTAGFYTQNLQTIKGCDSIVNLSLIVNPIYNDTIIAEICQGQTYSQYGFNVNTTGFYTQNLQTIKGCDSIINLQLVVNPIHNDTILAEICQGQTYSQYGFNENITGFYTQSLQTIKGCDSIINLSLKVNPIYNDTIIAEICQGQTYSQFGFNVNTSGFYTQNLQTTKGCDSIVNLSLIVNPTYLTNHYDTICKKQVYNSFGFNFAAYTSGLYTQNLQTIKGCDSIINLYLIVNPIYNDTITAVICNGVVYNQFGFNENTEGFYTQSLQTINGCDSIVNLNLIVNPTYYDTIIAEICQGETYSQFGFNENLTGFYSQSLQTTKGCDSIVNLSLIVNPIYNDTIFATICSGVTYSLYGFNETSIGFYTQSLQTTKGCDSVVNLSLDVVFPPTVELNMVTVDMNNNVVIWDKDEVVNHYNIYKEGNVLNQYDLIATVPYDSASMFVDTNSNPTIKAYMYKISTTDTCLNESELSSFHKTMHLIIGQGMGNNWNLSWTPYVGANYSTYNIFRGINSLDSLKYLTTISASNTSYTDINVPSGYVYYQVEIIIDTTQSKANENSIRSNYATNNPLGIVNYSSNNIITKLYPNPTEGKARLEIEGLNTEADVLVYDMVGRVVQRHSLNKGKNDLEIDLSGYAKGVYSVRIVNESVNQTLKLVVQ